VASVSVSTFNLYSVTGDFHEIVSRKSRNAKYKTQFAKSGGVTSSQLVLGNELLGSKESNLVSNVEHGIVNFKCIRNSVSHVHLSVNDVS
jgi:hypothetical protein